ncbi:MAG: hypothetical protein HXY39_01140 [Chloroflexi bacterium]|nr:hypothetical protein [Chloroflexota bacterium]
MADKEGLPKILPLEERFPCYNALHSIGVEAGDPVVLVNPGEVVALMRQVPYGHLTAIIEILVSIIPGLSCDIETDQPEGHQQKSAMLKLLLRRIRYTQPAFARSLSREASPWSPRLPSPLKNLSSYWIMRSPEHTPRTRLANHGKPLAPRNHGALMFTPKRRSFYNGSYCYPLPDRFHSRIWLVSLHIYSIEPQGEGNQTTAYPKPGILLIRGR